MDFRMKTPPKQNPQISSLYTFFNGLQNPEFGSLSYGLQHTHFLSLHFLQWQSLIQPFAIPNNTASNSIPEPVTIHSHCNQTHYSNPSKLPQITIVASLITLILTLVVAGFLLISQHRRRKQKVRNTSENSDDQLSTELVKEFYNRSASPLVALKYSNGWDPMFDGQNGNGVWPEFFNSFRFNLEEVESATQYFSESNLLGKSKFSAVYKGVLKDRKNKLFLLFLLLIFNTNLCLSKRTRTKFGGKSMEITIDKKAVLGGRGGELRQ
ncbi:hypothetical protein LguiB_011755 [Lonicera macranthoides]